MTGLRPHLIRTSFIYYYAIIRIHLNGIILIPSRRTFNRSRHASQKTEADQEMVYVPITPQ